ncbi:MAG: PAS domain-containing protein [Candidatus Obscuribacterales bacterium]|nr:PAS domain-containing protein [Candidatus Obscuribacterales bacterium]
MKQGTASLEGKAMYGKRFETVHLTATSLLQELRKHLDKPYKLDSKQLLEDLSAALEELSVASEEIYQQNAELISVQERLYVETFRFKSVFDHAPTAYLISDRSGKIKLANASAAKLFNINAQELVGKPLSVYFPSKELFSEIEELGSGERGPIERQMEVRPRDGDPIVTMVNLYQDDDEDVEKADLFWIIQDLSHYQK